MKAVAGVLVLAIAAIGIAMFLRGGKDLSGDSPTISVGMSGGKSGGSIAPNAVLRIAPKASAPYVPPAAPRRSALATEMAQSKAWKPIYDRLRNSPEGTTAEGMYYLAQILSACANVTDRKGYRRPVPGEDAKARFVSSISTNDPNRTARLAAYDLSSSDRCAELREVATTEKEIKDLREKALAAGDPKARAVLVAEEVWASAPRPQPGVPTPNNGLPSITDAQLDAFREIARTGDPTAAQFIGEVLASTMANLYVRAGPTGQPVDPRAFHDAWVLASCDLGANCGADNRMVTYGCAYNGQCGVDNLRDYYFYYGHAPAQSQAVGEYSQQILNAIRTGDWSYFQFVREMPPNAMQSVFRFGGPGR